jgi:pilus assembly protein Flp/PilA
MIRTFARFGGNQEGTTAVEYGILAGLLSVALIGGAKVAGVSIVATFNTISAAILRG